MPFALQNDESADVSGIAKLFSFIKYIYDGKIIDLLFAAQNSRGLQNDKTYI